MDLGLYEWAYIITNIFWVYTIYKLMRVFFDVNRTSKVIERLVYIAYYFLITSTYLLINIPAVLIILNLIAFYLITYNYESTFKKRVLSTVLIYLIIILTEFISVLPFSSYTFSLLSKNTYASIYALIVCRILSYVAALLLSNFKNIRKGESVPTSSWFSIVLIPIASLYINLVLFQADGLTVTQLFVSISLLFLINFATFYLYDVITAALSEKMQNILAIEQNKYYEKQFELIKTSLQATSAIRHDLKNHMFSIHSLAEEDKKEEVLDYVSNIMAELGASQNVANSGNTVIDSIINFKFQKAEQDGIQTALELRIPDVLEIPSFDMTIILGNLLDNALEAVAKVNGDRFINVKIKYDKGRLLMQADNPYVGEIKGQKGKLLTTKEDKENHGIGLESLSKVVQKYNGTMDIKYQDNIFSVSLLIYVD